MLQKYERAEVEIVFDNQCDVITASGETDLMDEDPLE